MSCVLRVAGTDFDVLAFLAGSPLAPDATYRRGDALLPAGPVRSACGFDLTVSAADDLAGQTQDAIHFLDAHEHELRRLGAFDGVEVMCLEFATRWRDVAVHTDTFPADLLWRAGALDIELAVTHYWVAGRPA